MSEPGFESCFVLVSDVFFFGLDLLQENYKTKQPRSQRSILCVFSHLLTVAGAAVAVPAEAELAPRSGH